MNKTLKGTYDKEVWGEEKSNRVLKPAIFIAGQDGYAESRNAKKQKYIINYNQTWTGGLIYFNISDETVAGHPNRRVLVDFSDRPNERADGYDQIVDSGSYLDTDTGDIYFNLRVMDGAYGATGGFGIEVLLSNRGRPLTVWRADGRGTRYPPAIGNRCPAGRGLLRPVTFPAQIAALKTLK